jgi:hypothetical protein
MARDSARQMLQAMSAQGSPRRMAQGGAAGSFSDDEVAKFIQDTYSQYGGANAQSHKIIADAMAQYGVGVDQVSRVTGYSPQAVQAELMGQQAAAQQQAQQQAQQAAQQQAQQQPNSKLSKQPNSKLNSKPNSKLNKQKLTLRECPTCTVMFQVKTVLTSQKWIM